MQFKFCISIFSAFLFISGACKEAMADEGNKTTSDDFVDMIPYAANRNELDTVKKMVLEEGRNASEMSEFGSNGLHNSARIGGIEIFKFLLAQGVDPFIATIEPDPHGRLPLHWAAKFGRSKIIKVILALNGTNVNAKDGEGETPLTLLAGSDAEYSPIYDTAPVDFEGSLRALLAAGADKNIKNAEGKTPAELAEDKPALLQIFKN